MKPHLLLGLLFCTRALAAGEGYVNFIRQTQQDTGVVWSMPVTPKGESSSPLTLESKGALFQLWTIEQATAKDYLLDQKLVGAYLPSASLRITTGDPYSRVPRTRADQAFTVTYDVAGLLAGAGIPEAATKVLMEHHGKSYAPGSKTLSAAAVLAGTPLSSAFIGTNGTATLTFPATTLNVADPTQASGEEHFVIHALCDGTLSQTQLATAFVQICPVASGTIAGVTPGQKIRYNAPPLTVTLKDLYPSSYTWLQVYPGQPQLNTAGIKVLGSELVLDQNRPHSDIIPVSNYDTVFPDDGTHTIELLTRTPFGIDRLHHVTVEVDRKLEIRAQLGGLDP